MCKPVHTWEPVQGIEIKRAASETSRLKAPLGSDKAASKTSCEVRGTGTSKRHVRLKARGRQGGRLRVYPPVVACLDRRYRNAKKNFVLDENLKNNSEAVGKLKTQFKENQLANELYKINAYKIIPTSIEKL